MFLIEEIKIFEKKRENLIGYTILKYEKNIIILGGFYLNSLKYNLIIYVYNIKTKNLKKIKTNLYTKFSSYVIYKDKLILIGVFFFINFNNK
jgi:hypothetical protein